MRTSIYCSSLIAILALLSLSLAPAAHAEVTAISEADELATDTAVTIQGRVTVASGTFYSALSDEGFAVNDRTGGIFVCTGERELFLGTSIRLPHLVRVGSSVRATGLVAKFPGFGESTPEVDVRSRRDIRRAR